MIAQDDPRHRQQRMLVQPQLTGKSVGERQQEIADLATELIDAALAAGDEMEVVGALAGPAPGATHRSPARVPGVVLARAQVVVGASDAHRHAGPRRPHLHRVHGRQHGVRRRARRGGRSGKYANPTDDLISVWVHSTIDGQPLSPETHRPRGRPVHRRRRRDHSHRDRPRPASVRRPPRPVGRHGGGPGARSRCRRGGAALGDAVEQHVPSGVRRRRRRRAGDRRR